MTDEGKPTNADWECRTIYASRYSDSLNPEYVVVRDATVWLETGPNGDTICAVDNVFFEDVPIKLEPGQRVRFGDDHSGRNLVVVVDDEAAYITKGGVAE